MIRFVFNDTATTEIYTLSLHDALPICQHKEMLKQVLDFFDITPDYELDVMKNNQSLFGVTERILKELEGVLNDFLPDLIFVQGDTTTAFVGALAGFYKKIDVAHVEAGLRSF